MSPVREKQRTAAQWRALRLQPSAQRNASRRRTIFLDAITFDLLLRHAAERGRERGLDLHGRRVSRRPRAAGAIAARACAALVAACSALRASSRALKLASFFSRFSSCLLFNSSSPARRQRNCTRQRMRKRRRLHRQRQSKYESHAPLHVVWPAGRRARSGCSGMRLLAGQACRAGTHACGQTRAGSSAGTGCFCATWRQQPRKERGAVLTPTPVRYVRTGHTVSRHAVVGRSVDTRHRRKATTLRAPDFVRASYSCGCFAGASL